MKKITSLLLCFALFFSLAVGVTAYWNEEGVHSGIFLGYNGEITVYFTHDYSCTLRDYTAEDFPKLNIEYIKNYWIDPNRDIEEMKSNPYFRRSVLIVIKDKSEESIRDAVYYLDALPYVEEAVASYDRIKEGDVNCDRTIDLRDVTHMLKHIAGWDSVNIEFHITGDMNWDDFIDLADVTILLQVLAGWKGWSDIGFQKGPY